MHRDQRDSHVSRQVSYARLPGEQSSGQELIRDRCQRRDEEVWRNFGVRALGPALFSRSRRTTIVVLVANLVFRRRERHETCQPLLEARSPCLRGGRLRSVTGRLERLFL
jgi:hypothetical protein